MDRKKVYCSRCNYPIIITDESNGKKIKCLCCGKRYKKKEEGENSFLNPVTIIAILFIILATLVSIAAKFKWFSKNNSISVGDIVSFGSYEQDNIEENGKEDIEWLVLAKEDGKLLLLTRYAIDCKQYNEKEENYYKNNWATCSLKSWANEDFINLAFSKKEESIICKKWGTTDKVFLLSEEEINRYLMNKNRRCSPTEYAKSKGVLVGENNTCNWWTRTSNDYSAFILYVDMNGSNHYLDSTMVSTQDYGVRLAVWIEE